MDPAISKLILNLVLRYLQQPSTWQGLTLAAGTVSAYVGVPVDQVLAVGGLALAGILILRDERKPAEIIQDAVAKALEDKVDKS